MADLNKIIEDLSALTVLEAAELAKMLEEKWGVSAAAPVAVAAPQVSSSAPVPAASTVTKEPAHKGKALTSPMVGTFYSAPSPDAEAFVKVGQTIKEGDVVCIVEAMKLMNEIESDFSGKITEVCVQDGLPVEFGQVLMYVE